MFRIIFYFVSEQILGDWSLFSGCSLPRGELLLRAVIILCFIDLQGVTALRISMLQPSLLCSRPSRVIHIYSGCPCSKKLIYLYPEFITEENFLQGISAGKGYKRNILNLPVSRILYPRAYTRRVFPARLE